MIQYQPSKKSVNLIDKGFSYFNHFKVFEFMLDITSQTITNFLRLLALCCFDNADEVHIVKSCSLYQMKL